MARPLVTASPNFAFLAVHEESLVLLATQAERLFAIDPSSCIAKVRLFAELLAQEAAARTGVYSARDEGQRERLQRLRERGILQRPVDDLFHALRKAGNLAVHEGAGEHGDALHALKLARELAVWFHRTFGNDRAFKPAPFQPPRPPVDATASLRAELDQLRAALDAAHSASELAKKTAEDAERARASAEERASIEAAERAAAEALMADLEQREADLAARLSALQATAIAAPANELHAKLEAAAVAAEHVELDEPATRRLIDAQLREAGWEADTETLRHSLGVRPQKHRHLAIAEWPTESGPADYVLFVGLVPVAIVEAKRGRRDVPAALEQAERYARALRAEPGVELAGAWDGHRVPFLFSTNGRPYLEQIKTLSGIWFRDARRPQNLGKPLLGWYTPGGLLALLAQDVDAAHEKLKREPTDYLGLRSYQLRAIRAAEEAIERGARTALLAMATGTGKTKTCIGLCYRLLKSQRFRRILFLVDRSALGEQATNAFKDTRLESLQTFEKIFAIQSQDDGPALDSDTRVHVTTVQSLVRRILYADDDPLPIDTYDCIVVDECHRGYLLDREMTPGELVFRSEDDYVSKYRRVLDHFDAVKIGLTATPALHTTQIFGSPVFTYSYREAVVDGHLVDHEPPIRIATALSEDGIHFKAGEEVAVYRPSTQSAQLSLLPDEVHLDVEHFNRRVLTESFNRVVCEQLVRHIDPSLPGKTLIFCATDSHADTVVMLMKEALAACYGEVEDAAVVKITGNTDRPLELIRRYKNERLPNIAVTVDLLTTGIDVPAITNLVFLRRVKSRILYEQMLGRATRRCDEIGKEVFRVFDAVDLYAALAPYTAMKPVVTSVSIPFGELVAELLRLKDPAHSREVLDQLVAKLDRKRRHLTPSARDAFELVAGKDPEALLAQLREGTPDEARTFFLEHSGLGAIVDRPPESTHGGILVSTHADELRSVTRGYGAKNERPEDYLDGFARFCRERANEIPALLVVTQRPRDLTRQQLREVRIALDGAGYSEAQLRAAWRDRTNQDIAASIIGHVRQAALGDPLVPYEERVGAAMTRILASRAWTDPQRRWLERIGKQLREEVVVDRAALDSGQFKEHGGFARLDKVFEGKLETILGDLADEVWRRGA